ncbi:Major sperm protein [Trichuris trichiura]|uniref:Major sperm protein n=1 Tax=Trichuris trichiura TaxID=36087 RepID=A0A077Z9L8_TRITR|nr:Major sperm protein [Trichuris trichiura]
MASTDDYDKEQQLFLLSYVELMPDKIKMHPSTTQFRVALIMVGNATEIPMTFRVETTQPEFLRPNPLYGTVEPRGATFIVLYLLKVNYDQFKVRQDKVIVSTAVKPIIDGHTDASNFWKPPFGPPKVQTKKVALINYCFDEVKDTNEPTLWTKTSPAAIFLLNPEGHIGGATGSTDLKLPPCDVSDAQLVKTANLESHTIKGAINSSDSKSKSEASSKSVTNSKKTSNWRKKFHSK